MTKPKLTPWFPAGVKPVRIGLYETPSFYDHEKVLRRWWDGSCWRLDKGGIVCAFQQRSWRGLAQDPKETA